VIGIVNTCVEHLPFVRNVNDYDEFLRAIKRNLDLHMVGVIVHASTDIRVCAWDCTDPALSAAVLEMAAELSPSSLRVGQLTIGRYRVTYAIVNRVSSWIAVHCDQLFLRAYNSRFIEFVGAFTSAMTQVLDIGSDTHRIRRFETTLRHHGRLCFSISHQRFFATNPDSVARFLSLLSNPEDLFARGPAMIRLKSGIAVGITTHSISSPIAGDQLTTVMADYSDTTSSPDLLFKQLCDPKFFELAQPKPLELLVQNGVFEFEHPKVIEIHSQLFVAAHFGQGYGVMIEFEPPGTDAEVIRLDDSQDMAVWTMDPITSKIVWAIMPHDEELRQNGAELMTSICDPASLPIFQKSLENVRFVPTIRLTIDLRLRLSRGSSFK
jgi:hypothetical protein